LSLSSCSHIRITAVALAARVMQSSRAAATSDAIKASPDGGAGCVGAAVFAASGDLLGDLAAGLVGSLVGGLGLGLNQLNMVAVWVG
jgi:hypothetical protein